MSIGGWSCPHFIKDECKLIKNDCNPGAKGCILYGKVLFSSPETQSNEIYHKKREKEQSKNEDFKKF